MTEKIAPIECPRCLKIPELCVCEEIKAIATRKHVLILQHPQEPDKDLGTALLAHLSLPNSALKIGLSWRNLNTALGREVDPQRWAVLYLGSGAKPAEKTAAKGVGGKPALKPGGKGERKAAAKAAAAAAAAKMAAEIGDKIGIEDPESGPKGKAAPKASYGSLLLLNRQGVPLPDSDQLLRGIEGIVVLDGTWSQAKTLWWRNAWLLKLRRAVLLPAGKSLYGELRREPRRECLSTIESIASALVGLGENPSVAQGLNTIFGKLLDRKRAMKKPPRPPRADRRT